YGLFRHRQNLEALVHLTVGQDQCVLPQGGPHLAHGVAAVGGDEALDAHYAPPSRLVTRRVRSSGTSAWDRTARWRRRRSRKRARTGRRPCCTTSTGGCPWDSWRSTAARAWDIRVSASPGSRAPPLPRAWLSTCSRRVSRPMTLSSS